MNHKNHISIGDNQWIDWIEFDPIMANPTKIDNLLESTLEFWKMLETECVSACCGIDAFSFWPEDIKKASANFDNDWLYLKLIELKKEVNLIDNYVIVSSRLNQLVHKDVFSKLIDNLIQEVRLTSESKK